MSIVSFVSWLSLLKEEKSLKEVEKNKAGSQTHHRVLLHHLKRIFFPLVTPKNMDY